MTARLPDLVVVGAPKAGTTSLAAWLRAHPQVAFSARKELEFVLADTIEDVFAVAFSSPGRSRPQAAPASERQAAAPV